MIDTKGGSMKGRHNRHAREKGAVSLFVVMFTAMLFVAVTVGFTVLMLSDEQQSTDNDLAQSALDSANAGAEDAKRVLAQYTDCLERGADMSPGTTCGRISAAMQVQQCNTIGAATGDSSSPAERVVKTNEDDEALQQAYTCVKITPNTDSYIGATRSEGDIRLIPLKTDGVDVTKITIEWLAPSDLLGVEDVSEAKLESEPRSGADPSQPPTIELPDREQWIGADQGSLLRVGSIQYQPGRINLTDIDKQSRAIFLYPDEITAGVTVPEIDLNTADMHRPLTEPSSDLGNVTPNSPRPSACQTNDSTKEYLCKTTIVLPPADDPAATFRYITVSSLYRDTSFRVKMYNGDPEPANLVLFRNVQPEIDVTGRANDVFRRIVSRVESADASEAPYPRAALGSTEDVCKNYIITDDPDDYHYYSSESGSCATTSGRITNPDAAISP